MFGWFKRRSVGTIVLIDDQEAYDKQMIIKKKLGFPGTSGSGDWLRLHEILKEHEDRIAKLEEK